MSAIVKGRNRLADLSITASEAADAGVRIAADGQRRDGFSLLAFADVGFSTLVSLRPELSDIPTEIQDQLKRDALYAQYIQRQQKDVESLKKDEAQAIPEDFDYDQLTGLSHELRQKLLKTRPSTLGQAGRVEGMTPAALTLILAKLRQKERKQA